MKIARSPPRNLLDRRKGLRNENNYQESTDLLWCLHKSRPRQCLSFHTLSNGKQRNYLYHPSVAWHLNLAPMCYQDQIESITAESKIIGHFTHSILPEQLSQGHDFLSWDAPVCFVLCCVAIISAFTLVFHDEFTQRLIEEERWLVKQAHYAACCSIATDESRL